MDTKADSASLKSLHLLKNSRKLLGKSQVLEYQFQFCDFGSVLACEVLADCSQGDVGQFDLGGGGTRNKQTNSKIAKERHVCLRACS